MFLLPLLPFAVVVGVKHLLANLHQNLLLFFALKDIKRRAQIFHNLFPHHKSFIELQELVDLFEELGTVK